MPRRRPRPLALPASMALLGLAVLGVGLLAQPARAESVSSLKRQLAEAIQQGDARQAIAAVDALVAEGSRQAADTLLDAGAVIEEDDVYRRIVLGLAGMKGDDVRTQITRGVGSGSDARRIVAAAVCANRDDDDTLEALIDEVSVRRDAVRRMILRCLVARRDKRAVPALIDLLEETEPKAGGGSGLVRRALCDLTGKELLSGFEWRAFWDSHGPRFELPAPGAARAAADTPAAPSATAARFFGRELDSDRIVFVIDVSGSMLVKDPLPEEGRPQTGGAAPDSPYATDSRVRIDRAKAELMQAVSGLPKTARFTIVAYSGYPPVGYQKPQGDDPDEKTWLTVLSPRLLPATESNVAKAAALVEQLAARGSTFTGGAVEAALEIPDADLIVLLSDGAPTEWEERDGGGFHALSPDDVRAKIRAANRNRRVTIDAFGFEGRGDGSMYVDPAAFVAFMKAVAAENGGDYNAID